MKIHNFIVFLFMLFICSVAQGVNLDSPITTTVAGPSGSNDLGRAVAIGRNNAAYVGGTIEEGTVWIGKYDSSLSLVAVTTETGTGSNDGEVFGLATDSSGNVYATGWVSVGGSVNIWVGKYDPNLVLLASATMTSAGAQNDQGFAIALDGSGSNVYVTGYVADSNRDIWLGHYNSALVLQSSTSVGVGGQADQGYGAGVDSQGNVFFTGIYNNSSWVAKYNSALVFQSSSSFTTPATGSGRALDVDSSGNVFITGSLNTTDALVAKFTNSLVLISSHTMDLSDDIWGHGIAVTNSGSILVIGEYEHLGSGADIFIQEMNSSLVFQSSVTFSGGGLDDDEGYAVAMDGQGNVYAAGALDPTTGDNRDIWVAKFTNATPTSSASNIRAYPNPFTSGLTVDTVTFDRLPAGATVKVYTLTGSLIAEKTANSLGEATWDTRNQSGELVASGIYYVFAEGNGSKKTTKVAIER